jgi:hypothetical protein
MSFASDILTSFAIKIMAILTSFANPTTVRAMSGNPDDTEVTPDQIAIYCNTADAKFKNDTNIPSLDELDPRFLLAVSAANKQGAILVRLQWGDRELRLPILRDLYDADIKSLNMSALVPGGAPGVFVAKSRYRTKKISFGDVNPYYLSMY